MERDALAWIELYPNHYATWSVVSLAGNKTTHADVDFAAILSVLDEAERLYQNA